MLLSESVLLNGSTVVWLYCRPRGGRSRPKRPSRGLVNIPRRPSLSEEPTFLQGRNRRRESARSTWLLKVRIGNTHIHYSQYVIQSASCFYPKPLSMRSVQIYRGMGGLQVEWNTSLLNALLGQYLGVIVSSVVFISRCKWTGCAESQGGNHQVDQGGAHQTCKWNISGSATCRLWGVQGLQFNMRIDG